MTRIRDDLGEHRMSETDGFDAFYRNRYTHLSRALILAIGERDLAIEATDEAFTKTGHRRPAPLIPKRVLDLLGRQQP